ncbi:hypothetical protein I3842_09G134300 [Carya illinoinensis]|uniref:Uncharacterized protein n=1 Tax=Carya illinoinensis TaxID=32201 RepID=A0A922E462_CARIL|nr:hypothetical protein I3842_09G134300 [Carya illinoinensis]
MLHYSLSCFIWMPRSLGICLFHDAFKNFLMLAKSCHVTDDKMSQLFKLDKGVEASDTIYCIYTFRFGT